MSICSIGKCWMLNWPLFNLKIVLLTVVKLTVCSICEMLRLLMFNLYLVNRLFGQKTLLKTWCSDSHRWADMEGHESTHARVKWMPEFSTANARFEKGISAGLEAMPCQIDLDTKLTKIRVAKSLIFSKSISKVNLSGPEKHLARCRFAVTALSSFSVRSPLRRS